MEFRALNKEECEIVRLWRNKCPEALRTPFLLTKEQQEEFYANVVCNRNANARYWGIWVEEKIVIADDDRLTSTAYHFNSVADFKYTFIGMCGLENIEWSNGRAEISIILNPGMQRYGHGKKAFEMLMGKAFHELGLHSIWGECYACNEAFEFWLKMIEAYNAQSSILPVTKFYNGMYFGSKHFTFTKSEVYKCQE